MKSCVRVAQFDANDRYQVGYFVSRERHLRGAVDKDRPEFESPVASQSNRLDAARRRAAHKDSENAGFIENTKKRPKLGSEEFMDDSSSREHPSSARVAELMPVVRAWSCRPWPG